VPTGETVTLHTHFALKSIGYRSVSVCSSVPFDRARSVVPSANSRVLVSADKTAAPVPGLYVAGWLKRGPSGIIGTNILDARDAVKSIKEDAAAARLPEPRAAGAELPLLADAERKRVARVVETAGWRRIDQYEREQGEKTGKPREKLTDTEALLRVAGV
jgi:ferredoxin--NADP+ reductase